MPMPVHVVTVVGGLGVNILPHTIRHYRSLGVCSFFIIIHLPEPDAGFVSWVSDLASSCGVEIESVQIDPDFLSCKHRAFSRIMEARPNDWFLPLDCDEFHRYPCELVSLLDHCEKNNYDYVRGCLLDRVSADGTLTPLGPDKSIWDQYPLGGVLTYPLLGGDPRKVVLARGHVSFGEGGHHNALSGIACPIHELFVPVHHFKWVDTLTPYLRERRDLYKRLNKRWWVESDRCLSYFETYGRIDLGDPRFLIAPCTPEYPFWHRVCQMVCEKEASMHRRNTTQSSTALMEKTRATPEVGCSEISSVRLPEDTADRQD